MGALGVVVVGEFVELVLELVDGFCWWSGIEPVFECLVKPLDFALGLRVAWAAVFLLDAVVVEEFFEGVSASFASGETCGEHHPVVGEG
ncbi:hypothetical protein GCM10009631_08240 [Corynebacterium glaucum]